jgi:hypothetical protein
MIQNIMDRIVLSIIIFFSILSVIILLNGLDAKMSVFMMFISVTVYILRLLFTGKMKF